MADTIDRRGPYAPRIRNRDRISPESRKVIDQLVRARLEAGMTQKDVGRAIGVIDHLISDIEVGKREAPLDVILKYASVVDLPWIEVP